MSTEIDPVQFGQLLSTVNGLKDTVNKLDEQVEALNHQITGGKGIAIGLMITAGGLGAGATKVLEHLLK